MLIANSDRTTGAISPNSVIFKYKRQSCSSAYTNKATYMQALMMLLAMDGFTWENKKSKITVRAALWSLLKHSRD